MKIQIQKKQQEYIMNNISNMTKTKCNKKMK